MTNRKTFLRGGIQFSSMPDTPDGRQALNGRYAMPCGCVIAHNVVRSPPNGPPGDTKSEDILVYWFENRVPWHDCNRVSTNTPSGSIPRDQRNGMKAPYAYLLNPPTENTMHNTQSPRTDDDAIEQEIIAKGKTALRVTPADIEANIDGEYYFTARDGVQATLHEQDELTRLTGAHSGLELLTFCVLSLKNGFTVTGESACASPENFDAELGRKIARENAKQKLWPLMGYQLKEQLFQATQPAHHPV